MMQWKFLWLFRLKTLPHLRAIHLWRFILMVLSLEQAPLGALWKFGMLKVRCAGITFSSAFNLYFLVLILLRWLTDKCCEVWGTCWCSNFHLLLWEWLLSCGRCSTKKKNEVDRELYDIMLIYFTFKLDRLQQVMALSCGIYANWKTSGHSLHMVLTHQQTVVCISTSLLIVSFLAKKMRSISLQCLHCAKFCWITWKQLYFLGILGWHGEFLVDEKISSWKQLYFLCI